MRKEGMIAMNGRAFKIKYKDCLYWILWICLFQGVISSYFGLNQINYVCDFLLIILLVTRLSSERLRHFRINKSIEFIPIIGFAIIILIGWIFNSTSLPMAIWGMRNYGRFFVYFIFCIALFDAKDVCKMEDMFVRVFPVHILLIAYQYIVEGLNQDRLSGIFGNSAGGNGGLMIYLLIMLCIIMARYEYKKLSLVKFIIYLMVILVNAALSELKFLFVVAVILLIWYLLMSKRKGQGMIMALAFVLLFYISAQILYAIFPEYANFLDIDNILNQVSAQEVYASQFDVGRTSVFTKLTPIIARWAGKDAIWIGIGLGNGDYSSAMAFLNSAFFNVYEYIHYTWLSLGYLFVETGYLGTIAYTSFFVVLEICAILRYQKRTTYMNLIGTFFPLVCLILLVYNSTLRSNYAYMIFAVISWNAICSKKQNEYAGLEESENAKGIY